MPRKKWINKNNADTQTYRLLYRSQNDPELLRDENAGERALFAVGQKGQAQPSTSQLEPAHKALHLADLEDDLDFESMRENEGEAAEHGIYFDDTSYDYMQHMRDLGQGAGDGHFIDALPTKVKGKKKAQTLRLEDALRQVNLDDEDDEDSVVPSLVDGGLSTMSRSTKQRALESQQDVPDEIAGFQPDMDPRLREALEALEDDAYVDEKDDEDLFGELTLDGKNNGELNLNEFEADYPDEDGWESDATEKAPEQVKEMRIPSAKELDSSDQDLDRLESLNDEAAAAAVAEDGDWLRDFAKYKRDAATKKATGPPQAGSVAAASNIQDQAPTLYTLNGTPLRQKKRKGAQTNPSAYSMTSSSLNRGDGLQLLDARFDQVEKMYKLDEADEFDDMDGGASMLSGMTGASKMSKMSTASFADPGAVRSDFNGMMDEFLGDWNKANPGGRRKGAKGKRGKNGNEIYGLQQLEEVRRELGPARINRKPQRA